jgi:hypothetical protein
MNEIKHVTLDPHHAWLRMNQRGITMDDAVLTVLHPEHIHFVKWNRLQAFRRIGDKHVQVIYELKPGDRAHILTVKNGLQKWGGMFR